MGRNIFVSYKYKDTDVRSLKSMREEIIDPTKVRDYVDILQELLTEEDHINLGEKDGEDLSDFKDSTIESKLRDKIFVSSITTVIVSPNMKEGLISEVEQWIPWEVAYSLKEHSREGRTSQTNAVLAVALPDRNDSYDYYIKENICSECSCRTLMTDRLFQVLRSNMFNIKEPTYIDCDKRSPETVYSGDSCYVYSVKWSDFKQDISKYLDIAVRINENISGYNIAKTVEEEIK